MKNLQNRPELRQAEVAAEYVTAIKIAKAIGDKKSEVSLSNELAKYKKGKPASFTTELARLSKLSDKLVSAIVTNNSQYLTGATVTHTAKSSMTGGVNSKDDFEIRTASGESHKFSLKMYKDISNVQVASGTWLSTLVGLAFEPIGRGSFITPCETKVNSKTDEKTWKNLCQMLEKHYEPCLVNVFESIKTLTKQVHEYRTCEWKPDNWTKGPNAITKSFGAKAAPLFARALSIIYEKDPATFKERILSRIGMKHESGKEIVFIDNNGILSSFRDDKVTDWLIRINNSETSVQMKTEKQGVQFFFENSGQELLKFTVPLTINSNGAWVNRTGFHEKEGMFLVENQRRPKKSQELDTSTNCWLKTPKDYITSI